MERTLEELPEGQEEQLSRLKNTMLGEGLQCNEVVKMACDC